MESLVSANASLARYYCAKLKVRNYDFIIVGGGTAGCVYTV
jgi:hypothetical protein